MKDGSKKLSEAEIRASNDVFVEFILKAKDHKSLVNKIRLYKNDVYNSLGVILKKDELANKILLVFQKDRYKTKRPLAALIKNSDDFNYLYVDVNLPNLTSKVYELLMKQIEAKYPVVQSPKKDLPVSKVIVPQFLKSVTGSSVEKAINDEVIPKETPKMRFRKASNLK